MRTEPLSTCEWTKMQKQEGFKTAEEHHDLGRLAVKQLQDAIDEFENQRRAEPGKEQARNDEGVPILPQK